MKVLHRDQPLWHLKNTCPACSYKLHGEKALAFKMLITMDGNNSLKRLRRGATSDGEDGGCNDLPDPRQTPGDYYLTREEVDKWAKSAFEEDLMKNDSVSSLMSVTFLQLIVCVDSGQF